MASSDEEYLTTLKELWAANWPAGFPREAKYPFGQVPLSEYLRRRALQTPDRVAYVFYGYEMTFGELDVLSERFAAFLLRSGLTIGDRVAVFLPNCPQFIIAFYGILKAGCVHTPVNVMFREEELIYELKDSEPRIVVCLDTLVELVETALARTHGALVVSTNISEYVPSEPTIPLPGGMHAAREVGGSIVKWKEIVQVECDPVDVKPQLDWLASLNYTGGTTGLPKGCQHTQGDMVYTAAAAAAFRFLGDEDEVALVYIPIFWIAGENVGVLSPVFSGGTCVLLNRWDPMGALIAIDRYRVTGMLGTVDNYVELMEHPSVGEFDLTSLRTPLAMSLVRRMSSEYRERWSAVAGRESVLREGAYGMTETHTTDTIIGGFQEGNRDLQTESVFCGLPMPGTEIKIVDFDTGVPAPLGSKGEIAIRTPSLFKGYWRHPEESAAVFRDGWFHTGDIGMFDQDGILHFFGRRKEMLKVNGMSVFPAELEVLISRMPDVAGCAVVGASSAEKGEIPVAYIQLHPDALDRIDEEALIRWCKVNMAAYKVPRIHILDALPLTATGKVKKDLLPRY
jgi:long-chain acyl-CoA synthetase